MKAEEREKAEKILVRFGNSIEIKDYGLALIIAHNIYFASLKVAESKLPNVKDWDEVLEKFIDTCKGEVYFHIMDFKKFLNSNYSPTTNPSDCDIIAFLSDKSVDLVDVHDEHYAKNFINDLRTLFSLPVSASEQKPDGWLIDDLAFTTIKETAERNKAEGFYVQPVYFSPQPNKVSVSDEIKTMKCNNCGTKMVYTQNTNCCDECWLKIG